MSGASPQLASGATHSDTPSASSAQAGMILMISAMMLLPVSDTFAKILTNSIDPIEATRWRMTTQAIFFAIAALAMRKKLRGRSFSSIVALSGLLITITLTALISAFAVMPIATAIAIFFVEPLVLTLLSGPLLGERVGLQRYVAVAVGFVGALIVIRPGLSEFGWATLLPLISATAYALNMIVIRKASGTRSGLTIQLGATFYATLILSVAAVIKLSLGWSFVSPNEYSLPVWGSIVGAGIFAGLAFLMITEAFQRVEASALAPFQYIEIVAATTLGYIVFGDFPDFWTWGGVAIILGSGLYVFYREQPRDPSPETYTP